MRRLLSLALLSLVCAVPALAQDAAAPPPELSAADTSWMLISTALVLLMTPALAFFYGGLVRSKNALNTMMMSYIALGFMGVLWAVAGYSLALSDGSAFIGGLSYGMLSGVGLEAAPLAGTIPHVLYMAFQGTFFVITAALISGAVVERMNFGAYVAFIALWGLLVYAPVCHWVWQPTGWIFEMGALDFAGGAVVHVNAAAGALVAALVLGPRKDFGRQAILPHNVPFVLLGAGLLWFGWFGFNGGSALGASATASLAFVNTVLAPMGTLVVWSLLDLMRSKKITAVGAATGIVVGLVAITPAAGFVSPASALALGAVAAVPSYFIIVWRTRTKLDDSLDVFAAHGIGGMVGAVLTGVFADSAWNAAGNGLASGNPGQVLTQIITIAVVFAYSGGATFVILKALGLVMKLRPEPKREGLGMDVLNHGEEAYTDGEGAVLLLDEEMSPKHAAAAVRPRPVMAS